MTNMARILTEQDFKKRMQSILEYIGPINGSTMNEADPNQEQGGAAPDPMGGENSMGGNPDMGMGGGDPMAGGQGAQGFNPQGMEEIPMGDDEMSDNGDTEEMEEGDEVIDIDALTGYQKKTAKGVGKVSDEIKALKDIILQFQDKVDANNKGLEKLEQELIKRAPNAEEKMSLRQQKSGPFTQSIEEYWDNNAPENYSPEDDNNGEGDPKYTITKADIDGVTNWNEIAKSFDDMAEINNLKDIFKF